MRRRQTGTLMCAASSNRTSPSSTIRPRSGRNSPAIILMMLVLPAPDGPNNAVAPLSPANSAFKENSPSCFSTSTTNMSGPMQTRGSAPGEPFRRDQRGERNNHSNDHERERGAVATRHLRECVDCGRDGLRFARNVGDEGNGGAKLAERPGKGQHHAGDDAG